MTAHRWAWIWTWLFAGAMFCTAGFAAAQDAAVQQAIAVYEKDRAAGLAALRDCCEEPDAPAQRWLTAGGYLIRHRGDYAGGEPFAEKVLEFFPDEPDAHSLLGAVYLFDHRAPQAEALFRAALVRFPDDANIHFSFGISCILVEKNAEGMNHLGRALELDPDNVLFHFSIGENHRRLQRLKEAERHLRRAAQATPPHPEAATKLAEVLAALGRFDEAERWYVQATQRGAQPQRLTARLHYAMFLFDRRRFDEALPFLRQVTRQSPQDRLAWNYLARTLHKKGQRKAAGEAMDRYRELQREHDREEELYLLGLMRELRAQPLRDGGDPGEGSGR